MNGTGEIWHTIFDGSSQIQVNIPVNIEAKLLILKQMWWRRQESEVGSSVPSERELIVLADVLKMPEVAEAVSHAGRPEIEQ